MGAFIAGYRRNAVDGDLAEILIGIDDHSGCSGVAQHSCQSWKTPIARLESRETCATR